MALSLLDTSQPLHEPHNLMVLAAGFLILLTVYLGVLIPIYNITLHPLAKVPGPKLSAAYHFPYFIQRWNGTLAQNTVKLHDIYGEAVRIRPNYITFTTAQAWKDIYGFRHGKGQLPKVLSHYGRQHYEGDIFVSPDGDHSRIRKLLSHAFSEKALAEQESLIVGYVDILIRRLGDMIDGPTKGVIDMKNWYNFTTFDVIGDLAFGESFGGLESGTLHSWVQAIFKGVKGTRKVDILGNYPTLEKVVSLFYTTKNVARAKAQEYSEEKVKKRLATETDRKDFMSYILKHNDEKGMTKEEMVPNAAFLILAGSETTATLLSGVTYYLLQTPAALAKLTKEIRTSFSSPEQINLQSAAHLKYLHAVLEEGLRLYPPVPSGMPRQTINDGEVINGIVVPSNTIVAVNQIAAYHSAKNFANPLTFAPERWLEDAPAEYKNDNKDTFQPFSMGPRNCIGRNLAYAEMRVILARMLWSFDMKLQDESKDWADRSRIFFIWEKPDLMVKLSRREGA